LKKVSSWSLCFRLSLLLATGKRYSKKAGERGADVDAINESVELADEIYVDTSIPAMIATKFEPQKKAPISGGPTLF
jgi:hypothetical protein